MLYPRINSDTRLPRCSLVPPTDEGVRALANGLPLLTALDLTAWVRVTDEGVAAAAPKLMGVTRLNLGECSLVADQGVQALACSLPGCDVRRC